MEACGCCVGRFCLFLLCGWMIEIVFGYFLTECMFAGVFICIDTDLIFYFVSVFVFYFLLCR